MEAVSQAHCEREMHSGDECYVMDGRLWCPDCFGHREPQPGAFGRYGHIKEDVEGFILCGDADWVSPRLKK